MSFSDDDLKRLEKNIKNIPDKMAVSLHGDQFRALLARLEAAEVALEHYIDSDPVRDVPTLLDDEVFAWCKAAGK